MGRQTSLSTAQGLLTASHSRENANPVPCPQNLITIGMNPIHEYELDIFPGHFQGLEEIPDSSSFSHLYLTRVTIGFLRREGAQRGIES